MQIQTYMPLFIEIRAKRHHINLNNYRNWHYQVSNNIKKEYKKIVEYKMREFKGHTFNKIELMFTMHRGDKRKVDRSNVLCIHEKFFCDALVELGYIEDDNDSFIGQTTYRTGEIDKINPGVAITITEIV